MGFNTHLSERHLMKLRVDYRLAEHDQFEGLDELLTRDVLGQETKRRLTPMRTLRPLQCETRQG
jgi:hypothetical protein